MPSTEMATSAGNTNSFAGLAVYEPRSPMAPPAEKKSRRQRQKAAQEKAQTAQIDDPTSAAPSVANNVSSSTDVRPKEKGWEANFSLAETKARRAAEALEVHNRRFPPKPKRVATKTTQSGSSQQAKDVRARSNNKACVPRAERPLPPCGIDGCPVRDKHPRRDIRFDDPDRPNIIKKLQGKGSEATAGERWTISRFLHHHKNVDM